jgi:hypothetical protein
MAVLINETPSKIWTAAQLEVGGDIPWDRIQITAAIQAIEDYWENTARAGLNTAINSAVSGYTFTAAQKKIIGRHWLRHKARVE